jgi:hypothetical protein
MEEKAVYIGGQMREIWLDLGELGWSMYLSAHLRWLRQQGKKAEAVMTLEGRECLYEGLVKNIFSLHWKDKKGMEPDCFGFYGLPDHKLRAYFNAKVPAGYQLSETQPLTGWSWMEIFKNEMIFEPYPYKDKSLNNLSKIIAMKEILVFPRYREAKPFCYKNLPKTFYVILVMRLCDEFPKCTIRTMGTKEGAYDITKEEIGRCNYINHIGKTPTIQALIDRCQCALGAVGSQSAPPKIMLLQNVPTFMIGHTRKRHQEEENWGKAKCGFCELGTSIDSYNKFHSWDCINEIVKFFKEIHEKK